MTNTRIAWLLVLLLLLGPAQAQMMKMPEVTVAPAPLPMPMPVPSLPPATLGPAPSPAPNIDSPTAPPAARDISPPAPERPAFVVPGCPGPGCPPEFDGEGPFAEAVKEMLKEFAKCEAEGKSLERCLSDEDAPGLSRLTDYDRYDLALCLGSSDLSATKAKWGGCLAAAQRAVSANKP